MLDLIAWAFVGAGIITVVVVLHALWTDTLIDEDLETETWLASLHPLADECDPQPEPRLPQ